MYAALKDPYVLRGWKHTTGALVNTVTGSLKTMDMSVFSLLLLCDGVTDLDEHLTTKEEHTRLKDLAKRGYIGILEQPAPVGAEQKYRRYDNRVMEEIQWSVTGRCNYRCRHCLMDAPDAQMGEMTTEQAFSVIDQMAECGVLRVALTGGEPFVRKDFWQLVDRLTEKHIIVEQIFTNGWLLTDEVLDNFEKRGLRLTVCMSFDGVGWHDWMRGVRGAEDAAAEAIKRCAARKFPVTIEMCLHRGNRNMVRETVNYLASIGADMIKIGNVARSELWCKNAEGNDMDIREYYDTMLAYIPFFYQDGMPAEVSLGSVIRMHKASKEYSVLAYGCDGTERADRAYICSTIRDFGYLAPDGRMLPCMSMAMSGDLGQFPNILETGLKAALNDGLYMDYINSRIADLMKKNRECGECPFVRKCCGGCRAAALNRPNGGLWAADKDACILWKEGYVQQIERVAAQAVKNSK